VVGELTEPGPGGSVVLQMPWLFTSGSGAEKECVSAAPRRVACGPGWGSLSGCRVMKSQGGLQGPLL
jgi:hypothetical protein